MNRKLTATLCLGEDIVEDVKDIFVDPNLISTSKSAGGTGKKSKSENNRQLQQVMHKLDTTLPSSHRTTGKFSFNYALYTGLRE